MRPAAAAALLAACLASPAAAQGLAADPPGPYVVDVRAAFGRGLGLDAGGHVYGGRLGGARFGVGGAFLRLPSDVDPQLDVDAPSNEIRLFAPQLSFNFGSAAGWSYLSLGYGRGRVGAGAWGGAVNAGGGARWFLSDHVGVGFDLRYYRLRDDGVFAVAAGLSLK